VDPYVRSADCAFKTCKCLFLGAHPGQPPIVVDFVHVLEYVWRAAWCFFAEGDPRAEGWVHDHARSILAGRASIVAAAIRRKATRNHLDAAKRRPADTAAAYLLNKKPYLDYPTALTRGWPIATGVIEGACRHLVKDRMDRTGARWGSQARRRSSNCGRSTATATSTPTGPTTWPKNSNGSTPEVVPVPVELEGRSPPDACRVVGVGQRPSRSTRRGPPCRRIRTSLSRPPRR
jgi:hypothetical protein